MVSVIILMFILAQAIIFAASGDGGMLLQPLAGSLLDKSALTIWSALLIGTLCIGWSSNYLSRLALPGLRSIPSLRLFLVVNWLLYLIGGHLDIWLEQVVLATQDSELITGLITMLSLATGHVTLILVILASLVLGVELIVSSLIMGARPQVLMVFRPVLVLFAIAATFKVIGEFGLLIVR